MIDLIDFCYISPRHWLMALKDLCQQKTFDCGLRGRRASVHPSRRGKEIEVLACEMVKMLGILICGSSSKKIRSSSAAMKKAQLTFGSNLIPNCTFYPTA